jgi:mono/diheme cytochrome c family protein
LKKLGQRLLAIFLALFVVVGAGISLTIGWRPFIGPKTRPLTSRKFESTPARVERGQYLFSAANCAGCHSERDPTQHGAPVVSGTEGGGRILPDDFRGRAVASNITPDQETGAGNWSDDQLARAIREGVGHDGRALSSRMPYRYYRKMSDEDVASVVVHLRSLPPIHRALPKTEMGFPLKYLMRSVPEPIADAVSGPDPSNQIQRGEYLVNLGHCSACHTPRDRGQPTSAGMEFSGGTTLREWNMSAASANITPDASGISYYDAALFIRVLRTGFVGARKLSSVMPFAQFRNMNDDDLSAVFSYLRRLPLVHHRVDNSLPPTYCKLCRLQHGAGDQN